MIKYWLNPLRRLDRTSACDRQTDRQTDIHRHRLIANTALAYRRVGNERMLVLGAFLMAKILGFASVTSLLMTMHMFNRMAICVRAILDTDCILLPIIERFIPWIFLLITT